MKDNVIFFLSVVGTTIIAKTIWNMIDKVNPDGDYNKSIGLFAIGAAITLWSHTENSHPDRH